MRYLSEYIDNLQAGGKYIFSREQAFLEFKKSRSAFDLAMYRLIKKGRIKRVRRDFYIIIPLEYKVIGSLPPSWFVHSFMESMHIKYYVGLLSAASLHGASHQQVMSFQVIANKLLRPINIGQVRLEMHFQKQIPADFLNTVKTETGVMLVSNPDLTICDLIKYINYAGQIHNVATIIYELKNKISINGIISYIKTGNVALSYVQRLGYLIDYLELGLNTDPIQLWVKNCQPDYIDLATGSMSPLTTKNQRWHILVNEEIEIDV